MGVNILTAAKKKIGTGIKRNANPINAKKGATHEYRLGGKGEAKSDMDGDGFMEIDCSGLVSDALKDAGYTMGSFGTHDLFNGNTLTPFTKKHFDIISENSKEDPGNLQVGDLILFKNNTNSGQHIAIFSGYNNDKITFYGSQTSTGPATVDLSMPGKEAIWYHGVKANYFHIIGTIRAKKQPEEKKEETPQPTPAESLKTSSPMGARKNSKYKIISTSPSVNKTPRGPNVVNVPYDVQQDLSQASDTSPNVNFNGDPVYVKTSHSSKVTGDKEGSLGGVKSGTVEAQSDPIEASPSVFVNGKAVVRVGDKQYMQGKNTIGKVVASESGSAGRITDEGKIVGLTQPEPIPTPYAKNKPTNNPSTSGALGSRTGSPVLLASGKLFYTQSDVELIASIGFGIRRTYISDERTGIFGRGWQCSYETQLKRSDPHTLSLIFTDNQTYRFTYAEKGFIDTDDLGAKLTLVSPQTFLLDYIGDAHTELYVNGFLSRMSDRNGNTLDFVRESNGKLVRITSQHVTLSFSYNKEGFVAQVYDHTNRLWSYTYMPQDTLSEVRDPLDGVTRYTYSATAHQLEHIIDCSGVMVLSVGYDTLGRVQSYSQSAQRFSYRYETNRVIKTDSLGDNTFYGIDNWGTIRAITYADGSTTKEVYENNVSTVVDAGGNVFVLEFDDRGRKIREQHMNTSLLNPVILYTYEKNNPYPSVINREDKITTHTYDERYNKLSTTFSDGTIESYLYEETNSKAKEIAIGRSRGNPISYTNTEGVTTQYAYNAQGQIIRLTDALGGITQYVYDELGNTTVIIDPQERIVQFEYDKLNRRVAIIETDKTTIRLYYDNAGRISAIRDSLGNMTRYTYDENGFLSSMINPAGQLRTFTREHCHLTSITREDGAVHTFEYDKRGRKTSRSIRDKTTLYTYDTLGNLLTIDDGLNKVEYGYDPHANIRLERQGDKNVSHSYSLDGSKRFIGYEGMHFTLMRNMHGALERIVQGGSFIYNLEFNTQGAQVALSYPNRIETKNTFDPLGRLTERSLGETSLVHYAYDKSSRITKRNTASITYDEGCRVTSAGDESYTYDKSGNLLGENSVIDSITGALLEQGDTGFSYDSMGRLIEKNSPIRRTTYEYDIEGYLIGYVRRSNNPVRTEHVEVQLRFTYDPLGRRLTKSFVVSLSNHEIQSQYHHRYLYAGDNIVAIYDNDTDELLATLLHEEDAVDSPLSIHVHPNTPLTAQESEAYEHMDETQQFLYNQSRIKRYYYHRDHQNSIIALSDKDAKIVEYYEYDVFGSITKNEIMKDSEDQNIQTLNPYRYTSREYDTDDLYYYRARYYDPTIGRFITPDPIGFMSGDTNFYRYVGNDPVNFVDPSGLILSMTGALASAVKNRPNGSYDGNPFNGIVPDSSVPKIAIPNSNLPQGKTAAPATKSKVAQTTPKSAAPAGKDGAKVKGEVPKAKVDEKCKDQKWVDPIKDPQLARYTQNGHDRPYWNVFGNVRNGHMHQGVDLFAPPQAPVYACVDGKIVRSTFSSTMYGNIITIKAKCPDFVRSLKRGYNLPYSENGELAKGDNFSENGQFYFMYAHLIERHVQVGDDVTAGQQIGKTGTSGFSTTRDPHLHFEVLNISQAGGMNNRVNPGYYVNYKLPENFIDSDEQKQMQTKDGIKDGVIDHSVWGDPSNTR